MLKSMKGIAGRVLYGGLIDGNIFENLDIRVRGKLSETFTLIQKYKSLLDPKNTKTNDFFDDATKEVVSLKSMDLRKLTAQDPAKLEKYLNRYIKQLSEYTGSRNTKMWDRVTGEPEVFDTTKISGRTLGITVGGSVPTPAQLRVFENVATAAQKGRNGVNVIFYAGG